jgi:hypothetical protein
MGFLDKLMGHGESHPQQPQQPQQAPQPPGAPVNADEAALARYRYMLQTAPPEAIEQAHEEAFAKLTPQQRQLVLQQLSAAAPPHEPAPASADPQTLARMATRAEIREPGIMERMFGGTPGGAPGGGGGIGTGGILAGSLLTSLAGGFIGSAIADHFFRSTPMGQAFGGFGGGGMPGGTTNIYNTYEEPGEHPYKDPDDTKADDLDTSTDDSTDVDDSTDDSDSDDSGSDDSDDSDDSGDDGGGYDDGGGGDDQST